MGCEIIWRLLDLKQGKINWDDVEEYTGSKYTERYNVFYVELLLRHASDEKNR